MIRNLAIKLLKKEKKVKLKAGMPISLCSVLTDSFKGLKQMRIRSENLDEIVENKNRSC